MSDFDIMKLEIEEPKMDIDDYSWTIYGAAGIGKSSLCSHLFPDPAFFQWEQGQNALRAKKVPCPDWKTFKGYIKKLQKAYSEGKKMPMKTAIMDTADFAWKMCTAYVCKMNGWTHPSDAEWGKGWEAVANEFEMEMNNLENIGIKPVYISHDKDKEFKPKNREKYNQVVPAVPTGCLATIVDKVDIVVYCTYEAVESEDGSIDKIRKMYFRTNGDYVAKSRLLYMADSVEFADHPKASADRVIQAFNEAVEKEFGEGTSTKKTGEKKNATKKEKKVEKVEIKKTDEVTQEEVKGDELTLDQIKDEIEKIMKQKLSIKEMTPVQLIELVQEHTGVRRITDVNDYNKAKKLLEVISA